MFVSQQYSTATGRVWHQPATALCVFEGLFSATVPSRYSRKTAKKQTETDFLRATGTIGEDVLVNGLQEQVLISSQKPSEDYDGLTISSLPKLATGDLIDYQWKQYLVISETQSNRSVTPPSPALQHIHFCQPIWDIDYT